MFIDFGGAEFYSASRRRVFVEMFADTERTGWCGDESCQQRFAKEVNEAWIVKVRGVLGEDDGTLLNRIV